MKHMSKDRYSFGGLFIVIKTAVVFIILFCKSYCNEN